MDDGSGTVQCTLFNNETASLQSIQSISLGSLVTVKGKIQEFRETRGLVVHSLCLEDSMPNAEWVRWLEIVKARKRVLNTPPPLLPPHLAAEKEALLRPGPVLLSRNAPKEHQPQPFEHQIGLAMEGFLTEQDFLGLALSWASFNSNTENNTFTYTKMVSDPRLLQAAHRVFETQHGTPNPSQPRLHSLFKRTLRGLVVGGHIYLSCPNTDAYAVILDETLDKELLHWFSTANRDASTQGILSLHL